MADLPLLPHDPMIFFVGDGSGWLVRRTKKSNKDGTTMQELWLSPFDWTRRMLQMKDGEIDYNIHPDGIVMRYIPDSHILHASDNPEAPLWLAFCTNDGAPLIAENGQCAEFLRLMDRVAALEKKMDSMREEIAAYEEDSQAIFRRSRDQRERAKEFYGFGQKEGVTMPVEAFIGMPRKEGKNEPKQA